MNGTLRLVGGDTMNYWIADFRDELLETIAEWDFLLINDSEARMLSGENNLRKAAAKILEMGPHTLVIKRGEYGAILWRGDKHFMVPGYLLEDVFDPTGAGDCFAGGFMGYLAGAGLRSEGRPAWITTRLRRAVIYGSVMGSFCCEQLRRGPVPDADARRRSMAASKNSKNSRRSNAAGLPPALSVLTLRFVALSGRHGVRRPAYFYSAGGTLYSGRCRSASQHRAPHYRFANAGHGAARHHLAAAAASADDPAGPERLAVADGPCGRDRIRRVSMAIAAAFLFRVDACGFSGTHRGCGGRGAFSAESEHALPGFDSDDGACVLRVVVRAALFHGSLRARRRAGARSPAPAIAALARNADAI